MKVKLTTSEPIRRVDGDRDVELGFGLLGEALSFDVSAGVVSFTCLFYGVTGLYLVDAWDLSPVVE